MPENPYQNPLDTVKEKMSGFTVERRWAMICYLPFVNIVTCVITAVRKVDSQFCLFHARQGLALFILWLISIVFALLSPFISLMMWGAVLLLHISGFVIAFGGNMTKIPVIGNLAMKIPDVYLFTWLTKKTLDKVDQNPTNINK